MRHERYRNWQEGERNVIWVVIFLYSYLIATCIYIRDSENGRGIMLPISITCASEFIICDSTDLRAMLELNLLNRTEVH